MTRWSIPLRRMSLAGVVFQPRMWRERGDTYNILNYVSQEGCYFLHFFFQCLFSVHIFGQKVNITIAMPIFLPPKSQRSAGRLPAKGMLLDSVGIVESEDTRCVQLVWQSMYLFMCWSIYIMSSCFFFNIILSDLISALLRLYLNIFDLSIWFYLILWSDVT